MKQKVLALAGVLYSVVSLGLVGAAAPKFIIILLIAFLGVLGDIAAVLIVFGVIDPRGLGINPFSLPWF